MRPSLQAGTDTGHFLSDIPLKGATNLLILKFAKARVIYYDAYLSSRQVLAYSLKNSTTDNCICIYYKPVSSAQP